MLPFNASSPALDLVAVTPPRLVKTPYSPALSHQACRMARLKAALSSIAPGDLPDDAGLAAAPIIEG